MTTQQPITDEERAAELAEFGDPELWLAPVTDKRAKR